VRRIQGMWAGVGHLQNTAFNSGNLHASLASFQ